MVGGGIWPKFELIQAFMHVLVTCRNEDDSIKKEGARVVTTFFNYESMFLFPRRPTAENSTALSPIWPNIELVRDFMVVLVTCKNEEDLIKNEGARVVTRLYINFSDAQGQITPDSVVGSGPNLNSFKLSCMSSLPARLKIFQSKLKELEWSEHFSHYKSTGIFLNAQGQLTPQS